MKYYLAYGSNLNRKQMKSRCPDAVPVGSCVVNDYELVFRGVATIEPKPGASVQCGVWKISKADEVSLDRYEGYPRLYVKQDFRVTVNGKTVRAMAYVMTDGIRRLSPPSTGYLLTIAEGYDDFGLDDKPLTIAAIRRD
ncbi:MAG: gamma-glutamylcyclotransferase [Clostridia bacterium]|nr:gamma-glutamylcyclotransferase [Clostridia bacterium]